MGVGEKGPLEAFAADTAALWKLYNPGEIWRFYHRDESERQKHFAQYPGRISLSGLERDTGHPAEMERRADQVAAGLVEHRIVDPTQIILVTPLVPVTSKDKFEKYTQYASLVQESLIATQGVAAVLRTEPAKVGADGSDPTSMTSGYKAMHEALETFEEEAAQVEYRGSFRASRPKLSALFLTHSVYGYTLFSRQNLGLGALHKAGIARLGAASRQSGNLWTRLPRIQPKPSLLDRDIKVKPVPVGGNDPVPVRPIGIPRIEAGAVS